MGLIPTCWIGRASCRLLPPHTYIFIKRMKAAKVWIYDDNCWLFICSEYLGAIQKTRSCFCFNCCNLCACLEVTDGNEDVLYRIDIPCNLFALPALEADFEVTDVITGEQVSVNVSLSQETTGSFFCYMYTVHY